MLNTKVAPDEFEDQVVAQLPTLLAVARRLTKSQTEAEDLVQDACVKAFRARDQYHSGTNLRAWLFTILKNTFINRYRRGGLERSVVEGPDADPLADGWIGAATMRSMRDPESLALRPVLEAEIVKAIDGLPEEFRLAVLLADVEELSYKEIADIMGCPVGTVMSRLHRGRRLLKGQLLKHAHALGIIDAETEIGVDAANDTQRRAANGRDSEPVPLEQYRRRRKGGGS